MPALDSNHQRATRVNDSQFMKDIKAEIEQAGDRARRRLARGSGRLEEGLHPTPADIQGAQDPLGRPTFAAMWRGGRRLDRLGAVDEVYNARADRRRPMRPTSSSGSFVSFRILRGRVKCLTAPGENAPVVHVRAGADVEEELQPPRQRAAGRADRLGGNPGRLGKRAKALDDGMVRVSRTTRSRWSR